MPVFNGPSGYHAWGGNTPVQDLVDAFAMEDGSKFDWSNAQHAAAPYSGREPRFYATIMYDGMQWIQRDVYKRQVVHSTKSDKVNIRKRLLMTPLRCECVFKEKSFMFFLY